MKKIDVCRVSIAKDFSAKSEKGEPIIKEEDGKRLYDIQDRESFRNAMRDLMDREIDLQLFQVPAEVVEEADRHNSYDAISGKEFVILKIMIKEYSGE